MNNISLPKLLLASFMLFYFSIYSQDQQDVYVSCSDPCVELTANTIEIGDTNTYRVESIDYQEFSASEGNTLAILDDIWSSGIDLDFPFCFFGQSYEKALINSNGVLTFSIAGEVENGQYSPNDYSGYSIPGTVPGNIGASSDARAVLGIFGVLQDTNPNTSFPGWSISYSVYGQSPFRNMVFNFKDLGHYMCNQSVGPQTYQIVLYETTNIIEVHVTNRTPCTNWESGNGVIGIQNADASIGFTPPGRNTGSWSAQNEAWRFIPDGTLLEPEIVWKDEDENIVGTGETINVCIDETTTFTSQATYTTCTGDTVTTEEEINVHLDLPIISEPIDLYQSDDNGDGFAVFDLTINDAIVLDGLNPNDYQISYFETETDAQSDLYPIENPSSYQNIQNPQAIYLKVENLNTTCAAIVSFTLNVGSVSINDFEFENLTVFPNPSSGNINIQSSQLTSKASIVLYDILGKNILSKQISPLKNAVSLDISSFVNGIYFIQISSEGKVAVRKVIKTDQ